MEQIIHIRKRTEKLEYVYKYSIAIIFNEITLITLIIYRADEDKKQNLLSKTSVDLRDTRSLLW